MSRMVKCHITGTVGDSSDFYKVGKKWFKDKRTYIAYLKSKDINYRDILNLITEDPDFIISQNAKEQIIQIILKDTQTEK